LQYRALLTLALAAGMTLPVAAAERVTVPTHARLTLICDSVAVSTYALHPGDELDFHVSQPLVVGGYVVVPQGARAIGHIVDGGGTEVKEHVFSTKVETHPMTYAMDYVMSADGGKIKLDGSVTNPPAEKEATAHMFFGRKQTVNLVGVLNKGTAVQAFIDHTIHVRATQRMGANSGYDE